MSTPPARRLSLARTILCFEWRRFLPALLSVSFAGLLMLVQLGLLAGMFGTVTVLADTSRAALWITAAATHSIDQSADIPAALVAFVRSHPDVLQSEALLLREAIWRSGGTVQPITLVGLRPDADALGCLSPLQASLCAALAEPGTVVVDRSEAAKLNAKIGGRIDIDGHRLRLAGYSQGLRSIGSTYVFLSQQTLDSLTQRDVADATSFVLVGLRAGTDADRTADQLNQLLPATVARAWTQSQLSSASQHWWLLESGVGAGFLFSTALGLLIAVVITSQTLRAVVLSQLREYAVFRAIGVSPARLGAVIVEQAAWIGALGALLMLLAVAAILPLARYFQVPFTLGSSGIAVAVTIGVVTAIGSGVLALRELYRLQPAELLR